MLTTFAALIMPVIVLLMAMVINTGHIVDSKIRLQIAADRAAYAGAAKEARIMNRMAEKNREMRRNFEGLRKEFHENSTESLARGRQRFIDVRSKNIKIRDEMAIWNEDGLSMAERVSDAVAYANYSSATPIHLSSYPNMLTLRDDMPREEAQYQVLSYYGMQNIFVDPTGYESDSNRMITYLVKDDRDAVYWMTWLQADVPAGFLTTTLNRHFPYNLKLNAIATAQPHGGSIEKSAFQDNYPKYEVSFIPNGDNYAH